MPTPQNVMGGSIEQFLMLNWTTLLTGLPVGLHPLKRKHSRKQRLVNRSSLIPDDARLAAGETFIRMLTWPETRSRIAKIVERGFQKPGDFEIRLGHHLGIE